MGHHEQDGADLMRAVAETVTDQALTWPDALVLIAFIVAGAFVLVAIFKGD